MRNRSAALHWTLLVALLAFPVVASAQKTKDDQEPVASLRTQTLRDDSELRALHNPVISADGAWMAAEERPDRGDGNVRVWSTEREVTFSIERGLNPRISRDSRWVSALQKPPLEESRTAKPKNKRAGQTLVLLDTQDGSRRTFDFVLSYDVTYSSKYLVYLQSPETQADEEEPSQDGATKLSVEPVAKERKVGTLHLVHLKGDKVFTIANVAQHATHETSNNIAYVLHDKGTGRDQLRIAGLGTSDTVPGWGVRGMRDGEKIEGLRWARDVKTLGFLDSTETTGKDGKPRVNSALYTWHVTGPSVPGKFTRVDTRALHNPVISADGAWMAAEERPDRGDGNVRVWSMERDVTFTIERGQNPRISRDSRWVSALQEPPLEDSRTAKPTNKRAGQTLVLLDTQDGSRRTFEFVLSYDMTYASTYLLYLQSQETKADEEEPSEEEATKPATKERTVGTLHQIPLHPARLARNGHQRPHGTYSTNNVVEFATYPPSHHFAYVLHDEETGRDTLRILKWGIRAFYYGEKGEKIEGLCWGRDAPRYGGARDPRGDQYHGGSDYITLGFLVSTETTGQDGKRRVSSAVYKWQPSQSPLDREIRAREAQLAAEFTRVDTPK